MRLTSCPLQAEAEPGGNSSRGFSLSSSSITEEAVERAWHLNDSEYTTLPPDPLYDPSREQQGTMHIRVSGPRGKCIEDRELCRK